MTKITLISDTHSYFDEQIEKHLYDADEIWHAGDFGEVDTLRFSPKNQPIRGVFGNIDGKNIRSLFPENLQFYCEGFNVLMTHIGGQPGKYPARVKNLLKEYSPDIIICGHSHILRVVSDPNYKNMLYINPGAAGHEGFHTVRTLIKMQLENKKIESIQVVELGRRGRR